MNSGNHFADPTLNDENLKRDFASIRDAANAAVNDDDESVRLHYAVYVLKIAQFSNHLLSWVMDNQRSGEWKRLPPQTEYWPVLYNEAEDIHTTYKHLRIGYDILKSRDPKRRGTETPFRWFAMCIIEKMEFIRGEALDTECEPELLSQRRAQHSNLLKLAPIVKPETDLGYRCKIAAHKAQCVETILNLPGFTKSTATHWEECGKRLFREIFPEPNTIPALAQMINDAEVTTEAQIRAQINSRLGKAIRALS